MVRLSNVLVRGSLRLLKLPRNVSYRHMSTCKQNPLETINNLIQRNELTLQATSELHSEYGLHLLLHNTLIALFKENKFSDLSKFNILFDFIVEKYLESNFKDSPIYIYPSIVDLDLNTFKSLKDHEKLETMLTILFQLSLNTNSPSLAFTLMINLIEKSKSDDKFQSQLINKYNISKIVDLLLISRSKSRNIKELDNVMTLVSVYNKFLGHRQSQTFEFSENQIFAIIDKASYTIGEDSQTLMESPFESVKIHSSPYTTIQLVIRQLGLVISERVSKTISYYVPDDGNRKVRIRVEEDNDDDDYIPGEPYYIEPDWTDKNGIMDDFKLDEILDRQLLTKYLQFCYFIINDRCKHNDPTTVYIIWTIIKPFHNKVYNSIINSENNNLSNNFYYYQTVSKVITLFSKNKRYRSLVTKLIYDLPLDSVKVCPELMATIVYHCSRVKNKSLASIVESRYDTKTEVQSDKETKNLDMQELFGQGGDLSIIGTGNKFTAGQARALLAYNLKINNNDLSLKIIDYLKNKLVGFTASDFNEVIRSILFNGGNTSGRNDSDEVAWKMICNNFDSNEPKLNKYAILSYLDYLINKKINNNEQLNLSRVNEIFSLMKLHYSKTDTQYWNFFNMSYFKYIIRKYPLNIVKIIYLNCKKFTNQTDYVGKTSMDIEQISYFQKSDEYGFYNNPFNTHYNDVRIRMDSKLQAILLRDIYQQCDAYRKRAYSLKSVDIEDSETQMQEFSRWIYEELIELNYNENLDNRNVLNNSIVVDLLKTIDKRSRKIGFNVGDHREETKDKMSDSVKRYRMKHGHNFPIGDITLKNEFENSLKLNDEIWKKKFDKKSGK